MMEGLGADSEEKHEPAGDIETAAAEGLKALDLRATFASRLLRSGRSATNRL
jgi:hypothetical protein